MVQNGVIEKMLVMEGSHLTIGMRFADVRYAR